MKHFAYKKVKDGDILLSHYIGNWIKYPLDTLITKRICAYTKSKYSHTAIIFRKDGEVSSQNASNDLVVVEAIAKGLVINRLDKYLDDNRYKITVIRILGDNSAVIGEALTDEKRAKMKKIAFRTAESGENYYDKKLLILIALAIRLWGKNGYEKGMNYLRCRFDNFWICSEWVQYLYAQVGILLTNTDRLLAPEDFNKYKHRKIIFDNLY